MSWNPLQREALEAMGFAVYRVAGGTDHGVATPPMPGAEYPPAPSRDGTGSVARTAGPDRTATGTDRLRIALARAAGDADEAAIAALLGEARSTAHLRGDPAAKRALWPRLRALRRPRA